MNSILITAEEEKAIRSLQRLAKKWPQSIRLFSWSGTLVVTKANSDNVQALVAEVEGIPNDGGDPDENCGDVGGMDCDAAIIWPPNTPTSLHCRGAAMSRHMVS